MIKRIHSIALLMMLSVGSLKSFGADGGGAPDGAAMKPGLSGALQEAMTQLDDEDYAVRAKAIKKIEAIFSQQTMALASVKDSEIQASLLPVLAYNDGLTRWLEAVLELPQDQRNTQLELAKSPEVLKVLSGLFSAQTRVRVQAIHDLPTLEKLDADSLLAQLISDSNRQVSLAAMEVAWDRKPTPLTVQALWHKAVEAGAQEHRTERKQDSIPTLTFKGRPLGNNYSEMPHNYDADIATDVLIHMNATGISEKLSAFFIACAKRMGEKDFTNFELISLSGNDANMRNAFQLAQTFKPKEILPALYQMINHGRIQTFMYNDGGVAFKSTNRSAAIAVFLIITSQPHENYSLHDIPTQMARNVWLVSDEMQEEKTVHDIQEWWKAHASEYVSAQ